MSKKFYIVKQSNFRNFYAVRYCAASQLAAAESEGYERISRKDAIALCVAERRRRRQGSAFSGYADTDILPYDVRDDEIWQGVRNNNKFYSRDDYIWERYTTA